MAYLPPMNGGRINASIAGNATGASLMSSGTMQLYGGNNISLSQAGQTITISGPTVVAQSYTGTFTAGTSNGGNTSLTSTGTYDYRSIRMAGLGNITMGYSNSSMFISGSGPGAISGVGGSITSGNASLVATGNASISINGQTISIGASQSNQQLSMYAAAGGNTTQSTSGTANASSLQFIGEGAASVGVTGGSVAVSVPSVTGTMTAASGATGNTAGQSSTGTYDYRSLRLAGEGNISVGYSNSSIIFSGSQSAQTQNMVSVNGSTGNISFDNGGNVKFGLNASTISASYSQTNQTMGVAATGNTTQSSTGTYDARNLTVNGMGNVSVGMSNGSLLISATGGGGVALYDGAASISSGTARVSAAGALTASINGQTLNLSAPATSSIAATGALSLSANGSTLSLGVPAQTNQTLGLYASGNTGGQSSNTTVDARSLSVNGSGIVTAGYSAGSLMISASQSVQTQNMVSFGGSTGNIVVSNANNVTFGAAGSTVTASASFSQSNQNLTMYATGNTAGQSSSSGINASSLGFSGAGNVSVGYSGGSVLISGNGGGGGGGVALYDGAASITSGTARFSASGALTASINGQTLNLSVPATSSLSATGAISLSSNGSTISIGAANQVGFSAGSNTVLTSTGTYDYRSLYVDGGGIVSAGMSGGSLLVSATTSQSNQNINLYAVSNSTVGQSSQSTLNASSLAFKGMGNVSVGYSASSIIISGSGGGGGGGVALYDGANSITSGTASFADSNGVSFGFNGQTITGSVPAVSSLSATGAVSLSSNGGTISIGAPNQVGFTAGSNSYLTSTGTYDYRSLYVNAQGNISAGMSNGTLMLSASGGGGGGGGVAVYDGTNSISSGTMDIVDGGAVTATINGQTLNVLGPATSLISGTGAVSISTNGSTINIGAPVPEGPMMQYIHNSAAFYSSNSSVMSGTLASIERMLIPTDMSFSRVDIPVFVTGGATSATANTAAMAVSAVGVIYTRSGSTLSPIIGQASSTTYSYNSSNTASVMGARVMSFNLATSLTAGEYYLGLQIGTNTSSVGTATTNIAWSMGPIFGSTLSASGGWNDFGAATASTINVLNQMQGVRTVSIANTSQTIQQSQIVHTGTAGVRANMVVIFRNN